MVRRRPPDKVRRFKRTKAEEEHDRALDEARRNLAAGGAIDDSIAEDPSEAARGDG